VWVECAGNSRKRYADAQGTHFQRWLPIDVARGAEVLLAFEMNGEPIPDSHDRIGFVFARVSAVSMPMLGI
jgi:DMSO/TMAO reductase YedYZ molybdopterin-dependent catalytic subunit